jgi:hypothetical protein
MLLTDRFWRKVDRRLDDECWPWLGGIDPKGYGQFHISTPSGRRTVRAHRIAYELTFGPIPNDMPLDHVRDRGCTLKHCVNPYHLEPVTHAENMKRAMKTHCHRGHPYSGDNIYFRSDGRRDCRACHRELEHKRYQEAHDG